MSGTSMQDPTLLKLRNAGEMAILKVASCAPLKMGQYPEVSIVGQAVIRDELTNQWFEVRMPEKSAVRQFERMNLEYREAIGAILKISRDPNQSDPSRPYWGATLVQRAGEVPTPTIPVPPRASQVARPTPPHHTAEEAQAGYFGMSAPPPDDRDSPYGSAIASAEVRLEQVFALHTMCFEHTIDLAKIAVQNGGGLEDDAISALTAQCFIEACKRGIIL